MTFLGQLFSGDVLEQDVACVVGILVSVYAWYVEVHKHRDPKYVAACDFNSNMNCSRVLTSQYGKGFGVVKYLVGEEHFLNVPNCLTGIAFYLFQLTLVQLSGIGWVCHVLFVTSAISCIGSVYLAYILFFVLKDICVVCLATYAINFYLLYHNYHLLYI